MDNAKELLHAKIWYLYVNEKENIVKGGYLVEFVGHDGKKVLWEVAKYHVVEDTTDHDEIRLRGFDFNFSTRTRRG